MGAVPAPLEADTGARLACELSGVTKVFGAVRAVDDVTLDIVEGSLTCLIGPNGAGKSTLLGCVSGFLLADEGSVRVGGRDVTRQPPHLRAQQGLATVFQTTRPLSELSVLDNAAVGAHVRSRSGFVESMLRPPWQRREQKRVWEEAHRALETVGLDGRASDPAAVLPLGQLRLLAIARALAQHPSLLLLDEPAAGLRAGEKARLIDALQDLSQRGLTMVLVEHDMQFVGALAERVVVLDRGASSPTGRRPRSEPTPRSSPRTSAPRLPYDGAHRRQRSRRPVRPGGRARRRLAARSAPASGSLSWERTVRGSHRFSTPSAASYGPPRGEVRVAGDDVTGRTPNHVVRRGLTQVPEGRQVFPSLPVEANLLLGAFGRSFRTEIVTSTIRYLRRRTRLESGSIGSTASFPSSTSSATVRPDARPAASSRWSRSDER